MEDLGLRTCSEYGYGMMGIYVASNETNGSEIVSNSDIMTGAIDVELGLSLIGSTHPLPSYRY